MFAVLYSKVIKCHVVLYCSFVVVVRTNITLLCNNYAFLTHKFALLTCHELFMQNNNNNNCMLVLF